MIKDYRFIRDQNFNFIQVQNRYNEKPEHVNTKVQKSKR